MITVCKSTPRYYGRVATQSERRKATRGALLAAATELFSADGFEVVTIDDVANAAGVTRGAFYHHFDNKEAIFEAVFRAAELSLRDAVILAANGHGPTERLVAGCRAFVANAGRDNVRQIVLIDGPAILGWEIYKRIDEELFLAPLAAAITEIRPNDARSTCTMLARALLASVCEFSLQAAQNPRNRTATDRALVALVHALAAQ